MNSAATYQRRDVQLEAHRTLYMAGEVVSEVEVEAEADGGEEEDE